MFGHATYSLLIDMHHPVMMIQQRAPFGSWRVWKGTLLLTHPPCLCCWIDLADRGRLWLLLLIQRTDRRTMTQPWAPPPFTHRRWLYSPHPAHSCLTLTLTCRGRAHFAGLHSPITGVLVSFFPPRAVRLQQTRARWGAAFHVSPRTTSDSPARVSSAGTGENTCPGVGMAHMICLTSTCFRLYMADERSQWYFSGLKLRGEREVVNFVRVGSRSNGGIVLESWMLRLLDPMIAFSCRWFTSCLKIGFYVLYFYLLYFYW